MKMWMKIQARNLRQPLREDKNEDPGEVPCPASGGEDVDVPESVDTRPNQRRGKK